MITEVSKCIFQEQIQKRIDLRQYHPMPRLFVGIIDHFPTLETNNHKSILIGWNVQNFLHCSQFTKTRISEANLIENKLCRVNDGSEAVILYTLILWISKASKFNLIIRRDRINEWMFFLEYNQNDDCFAIYMSELNPQNAYKRWMWTLGTFSSGTSSTSSLKWCWDCSPFRVHLE